MESAPNAEGPIVARRVAKRARRIPRLTPEYCGKCGYRNAADDTSCQNCGRSLSEDMVRFRADIYDDEGTVMGEYWLTDQEVLRIGHITQKSFLLWALVLMLTWLAFTFAGAAVGQPMIGTGLGTVLVLAAMIITSSHLRSATLRLSLDELKARGRIQERIPWATVLAAIWSHRGKRLTLELSEREPGFKIGRWQSKPRQRTLELEIHQTDAVSLDSFLVSKLSGRVSGFVS